MSRLQLVSLAMSREPTSARKPHSGRRGPLPEWEVVLAMKQVPQHLDLYFVMLVTWTLSFRPKNESYMS